MYRITTFGVIGRFAISLIAVVVIQGILAFRFRVFEYFDLPLIFSVYYGFTLGRPTAAILIGSALGLMQDSLSGAALGTNGLSKTLIAFLAAASVGKFDVEHPVSRIFALFLFTIGDGVVVTILDLMVETPNSVHHGDLSRWALTATFNTLLGFIILGSHDRFGNART